MMSKQVVFVCTGNVCRSPLAEYLFRHRLRDQSEWTAQSAGVFAAQGVMASQHSVEALAEWDIDLSPHRSQPLTADLVKGSDIIAVMTEGHRREVLNQFPEAAERVYLLTAFGTGEGAPDISDPIGLSLHVYRSVRDQIDSALADLILWIREQEG